MSSWHHYYQFRNNGQKNLMYTKMIMMIQETLLDVFAYFIIKYLSKFNLIGTFQYLHITAHSLAKPLYANSKAPLCFEVSSTLVKNAPMVHN